MDITVTDAVLVARDAGPNWWAVGTEVVHDDGTITRTAHHFPESILEQRAAEYGLDPDDLDQLLEVVLLEPYLEAEPNHPDELYSAATVEDARAHHLARIAARKGPRGRVRSRNRRPGEGRVVEASVRVLLDNDTDPDTPLDMVRRETAVDRARVEVLREDITGQREQIRARRAAARGRTDAELRRRPSAAELREQLDGSRGRDRDDRDEREAPRAAV